MKKCADDVRVAYPLFQTESGGSTPTSALDLHIGEIPVSLARELNMLWHSRLPNYSTGFCLSAAICYGAQFQGLYYAVAIWSAPVARLLPHKKWLELRRFAIAEQSPKNTASRMLAVMSKLIRSKFPIIERLISYQDTDFHKGTIYKAAGWQAAHLHKGGSWDRPNSRNTYNKKPRTRPDLNNAIGAKIRWEYEL